MSSTNCYLPDAKHLSAVNKSAFADNLGESAGYIHS